MNPLPTAHLRIILLLLSVLLALVGPAGAQPVSPMGETSDDEEARELFEVRVERYLSLHRQLDQKAPPAHNSQAAGQIAAHRQGLGALIIEARRAAKRGELFTQEVEAWLRRLIRREYPGDAISRLHLLVKEDAQPIARLRINTPFPIESGATLMPPRLLAAFPHLPEELQYRFVSRHLVLVDTETNLIIDFIYNMI